MTLSNQPIHIKAAAWTIGVHVLLFLLFIFLKYSLPPVQPVEELGMEVNLGTSDEGSGTDQPMSIEGPASGISRSGYKTNAAQANDSRSIEHSDDPDAPAVIPANTPATGRNLSDPSQSRRNANNRQEENARHAQRQQPRYVYHNGAGSGGNNAGSNQAGTGEGNTSGPGDRGVPGGTPGASDYEGSPGNGTGGISHTLSGREISPKQFVAEFNKGGRVVVRVKVDREGNIISKSVISSPDSRLSEIALQKVSQAKFSKNPSAAPEQIGDITLVFRTRAR